MMDQQTIANRIDTSFETLTSAAFHLDNIMTQSEDFSQLMLKSIEDNIIERQLKKISQNLNTFTMEHFKQLRDHIQAGGF